MYENESTQSALSVRHTFVVAAEVTFRDSYTVAALHPGAGAWHFGCAPQSPAVGPVVASQTGAGVGVGTGGTTPVHAHAVVPGQRPGMRDGYFQSRETLDL